MNLLISNVTIFSNDEHNQILRDHTVVIEDSTIKMIVPDSSPLSDYAKRERLDGGGRLLMPGLTNGHMHFYGLYARGLALPSAPVNFAENLAKLWWRLDSVLDLNAVYYSALQPAIVAVKNGVTSIIDHHASPNATEGSLDKIEEAMSLVGVRGLLCYEVSDRDGKAARDRGLEENARYINKCRAAKAENGDHLFDGMMGLHASFTLDDDSLEMAADIGRKLERGCHIHLLEDKVDEVQSRAKYGAGAVERLHKYGVLSPRSIAGHAIHLDEPAADLLIDSGSIVAHNPQSNMNNAVGRPDVFNLLDRGVTVGIGTDGMTPDVKVDVRTGYLLHKHHLGDPTVGWNQFETMLLKNNPQIYERLTGQKIGRIAPGYLADIILVDYDPPTPLTGDNFWGHFLYGIIDAPVNTSIINGRIIMHDKQIAHIDEAQIAHESRICAQKTWQRFYK